MEQKNYAPSSKPGNLRSNGLGPAGTYPRPLPPPPTVQGLFEKRLEKKITDEELQRGLKLIIELATKKPGATMEDAQNLDALIHQCSVEYSQKKAALEIADAKKQEEHTRVTNAFAKINERVDELEL